MGIADDDDFDGDSWDEATADSKTRVRSASKALAGLWDDSTTDDDSGASTKIVDASKVLRELGHLATPDAPRLDTPVSGMRPWKDAPRGFSPVSSDGVADETRQSEPPRSGQRPSPRPLVHDEKTPALGHQFMLSLASAESTMDEGASVVEESSVVVEEASLSAEESAAIEAEIHAEEAPELAEHCAELIDTDALPKIVLTPKAIAELSLDHRAGFLLSLIDGVSTVHDILDMCGMPQMEALEILFRLAKSHVIAIEHVG